MEKIFVFDTETTGLPPRKDVLITDSDGWGRCRIVQIAWEVYDTEGNLLSSYVATIKPDGFVIPKVASDIHGITQEVAMMSDTTINDVLDELSKVLPDVATAVAHNMRFDDRVLLSELHRYGRSDLVDEWSRVQKECTMLMGTRYQENKKWPKLCVLYERLFGEQPSPETLHHADTDVALCSRCYFHMIKS
jgi:DNA polymerase III epsilon subunit-like protein